MLVETTDTRSTTYAVKVVEDGWFLMRNWGGWTTSLDKAYIGNYGECQKAINHSAAPSLPGPERR